MQLKQPASRSTSKIPRITRGLCAALEQLTKDRWKNIAFTSKLLKSCEKSYSVIDWELLDVVWSNEYLKKIVWKIVQNLLRNQKSAIVDIFYWINPNWRWTSNPINKQWLVHTNIPNSLPQLLLMASNHSSVVISLTNSDLRSNNPPLTKIIK